MCMLLMLIQQRGLSRLNALSTSRPINVCIIKECSWASDKWSHTVTTDPCMDLELSVYLNHRHGAYVFAYVMYYV